MQGSFSCAVALVRFATLVSSGAFKKLGTTIGRDKPGWFVSPGVTGSFD
jgi:hypothetical protein